jgi:hypothetical protein
MKTELGWSVVRVWRVWREALNERRQDGQRNCMVGNKTDRRKGGRRAVKLKEKWSN